MKNQRPQSDSSGDLTPFARLDEILISIADRQPTQAEEDELALLLETPEFRRRYIHYMMLHGELTWESNGVATRCGIVLDDMKPASANLPACSLAKAGVSPLAEALSSHAPQANRSKVERARDWVETLVDWRSHRARFWATTVAATLAFWAGWLVLASLRPDRDASVAKQNAPSNSAQAKSSGERTVGATLIRSVVAEWKSNKGEAATSKRRIGDPFMVGEKVQLAGGLAELKLASGVTVVIEGPAQYELIDANAGQLDFGRIVANVPKSAVGYSIKTSQATVIDLGTEFGVEAWPDKDLVVEVFAGRVSVFPDPKFGKQGLATRTIPAGVSINVNGQGQVRREERPHPAFVRNVEPMVAPPLDAHDRLILGDKPVAYWPLHTGQSVAVDVVRMREASMQGSIQKGPSGAAMFDGQTRLNAAYDPKFNEPNFTIEAWARPENNNNYACPFSSRIAKPVGSSGYAFYLNPTKNWAWWLASPKGWNTVSGPTAVSEWTHCAIRCEFATEEDRKAWLNSDAATIKTRNRLYINGAPVVENVYDFSPNRAGNMMIGAAAELDGAAFYWKGSLASIAVFDRVLSSDEIARHAANKPAVCKSIGN